VRWGIRRSTRSASGAFLHAGFGAMPPTRNARFWFGLKDRLPSWKFRRQPPIGRRFADFACPREKLVTELDGGQRGVRRSADEARTAELAAHGYRVLRFWTIDVVENFEGVLETVRQALETPPPHPALSAPGAERE